MAMTLFNNHCEPCSKSELDLESLPPVQVGIIDDYVVCTGPKSALSGTNPLEFEISASGDDYIDLSQCYLSLKCKVKNSDGTDLRTQTTDGDGNVTEGKPGICRACQFVPSFPISSSRREFQLHNGVHIGGLLCL